MIFETRKEWIIGLACLVVFVLSTATQAAASEGNDEAVVSVYSQDECASRAQTDRLVEHISTRVPVGRMRVKRASGPVDAAFSVVWRRDAAEQCVVTLIAPDQTSTLPLADGADEDEVRNTASRVAWLLSASVPTPAQEPEPEPEPEAAPEPESGDRQPVTEEPEPEPAPAPEAAPAPVTEADPSQSYRHVAARATFMPWLSLPGGAGRDVVTNYAFNLVGFQRGLEGMEFGLVANVDSEFADGLQIAGGANIVGERMRGVQMATGLNWAQTLEGAQLSAGFNVAAGPVTGGQVGPVNWAGDVRGLQVGTVNVGRDVDGIQLGLVNIARESDVSLGLININYNRPLYLQSWVNELGLINVGLQHGSRYVHWSLSGGASPLAERPLASAGLGLNGHFPLGVLYLEAEARVEALAALDEQAGGLNNSLRLTLGLPIVGRFALFGGVSANVLVTEPIVNNGRVLSFPAGGWARKFEEGATDIWLWPGFFAGIRL